MSNRPNPLSSYISHSLAAAHREINRSLTKRLRAFGVQLEAWRVMELLDEMPNLSMSELAALVLMNPPTLTKLVDRMVSDGLVHRQIAQEDQRQVNLVLTDLGLKRLLQIRDQVQSEDDQVLGIVGEENLELFSSLLERISIGYK